MASNTTSRTYDTPVCEYADLMTIDEWFKSRGFLFLPSDGFGCWVKDGMESKDENVWDEPQDATHVAWYNK